MAIFLKIVSGTYLALVWAAFVSTFAGAHLGPPSLEPTTVHVLGFFDRLGTIDSGSLPSLALLR